MTRKQEDDVREFNLKHCEGGQVISDVEGIDAGWHLYSDGALFRHGNFLYPGMGGEPVFRDPPTDDLERWRLQKLYFQRRADIATKRFEAAKNRVGRDEHVNPDVVDFAAIEELRDVARNLRKKRDAFTKKIREHPTTVAKRKQEEADERETTRRMEAYNKEQAALAIRREAMKEKLWDLKV